MSSEMGKGFKDHLRVIGSIDNGRNIGRTTVILHEPEMKKDAVQKRKAKKVPLGKQAEHSKEVLEAQEA